MRFVARSKCVMVCLTHPQDVIGLILPVNSFGHFVWLFGLREIRFLKRTKFIAYQVLILITMPCVTILCASVIKQKR